MKNNKKIIFGTILSIFVVTLSLLSVNSKKDVSDYQNSNNIKTNNNSTTTYELNAENLSYDNSKTGLDCKNVQCVIDEIKKKLNE